MLYGIKLSLLPVSILCTILLLLCLLLVSSIVIITNLMQVKLDDFLVTASMCWSYSLCV